VINYTRNIFFRDYQEYRKEYVSSKRQNGTVSLISGTLNYNASKKTELPYCVLAISVSMRPL